MGDEQTDTTDVVAINSEKLEIKRKKKIITDSPAGSPLGFDTKPAPMDLRRATLINMEDGYEEQTQLTFT